MTLFFILEYLTQMACLDLNFVKINPFQVENLPSNFFLNPPTPVGHPV